MPSLMPSGFPYFRRGIKAQRSYKSSLASLNITSGYLSSSCRRQRLTPVFYGTPAAQDDAAFGAASGTNDLTELQIYL